MSGGQRYVADQAGLGHPELPEFEWFREPIQAASVRRVADLSRCGRRHELPGVRNCSELLELESVKHLEHGHGREDAMRVEADAWSADRNGQQQGPARRKDANELSGGRLGRQWIDGITISAESDVLENMKTGKGRDGPRLER